MSVVGLLALQRIGARVPPSALPWLVAYDRIPLGLILLGFGGEFLFANDAAWQFLQNDDGMSVSINPHDGATLFTFLDAAVQARFMKVRASTEKNTTPPSPWSVTIESKASGNQVRVHLTEFPRPLPSEGDACVPRAALTIVDPSSSRRVPHSTLQTMFRLSPAEIRVAEAAISPVRLNDLAQTLGISVNTAKTHLQGIYAKTGVSSRQALLDLIWSLHLSSGGSIAPASRREP